jgi:hypothetical protein
MPQGRCRQIQKRRRVDTCKRCKHLRRETLLSIWEQTLKACREARSKRPSTDPQKAASLSPGTPQVLHEGDTLVLGPPLEPLPWVDYLSLANVEARRRHWCTRLPADGGVVGTVRR